MPLKNAPTRNFEKQFITPLIADVLFSELVDCNRIDIPEYGTPHPNTDRWPDHKLCYVTEEPESQREDVFRFYYIADRQTQDLYNFESTRQSVGGREFQIVRRSYVNPRETFEPHAPEFRDAMPDTPEDKFEGLTYVYFTKQQTRIGEPFLDSLYVAEEHIYIDETMIGALTEVTKSRPNLIPEKFRWLLPAYRQTTIEAGMISTTPELEDDDISVTENQINPDIKLVTRTKNPDLSADDEVCVEGTLTDTWGVNTTEECIVPAETECDSGYGVKQSVSERIDENHNLKRTEYYPEDEENDGIIYTLTGREFDEVTGTHFIVTRSLVDAARAIDIAIANDGPYKSVEVQPLDKWHSIMITGQIDGRPENQEWFETGNINLPNRLKKVGVIWDGDSQSDYDAGGVDNIPIIIANDLEWSVKASASASASIMAAPYTEIDAGYQGTAQVRVVRTFHQGPPPQEEIPIHIFKPVYGTITINGVQATAANQAYKSGVGRTNLQAGGGSRRHYDTRMAIHNFGPVEWDEAELEELGDPNTVRARAVGVGGSTPSAGLYPVAEIDFTLEGGATLHLPASSAPLRSGDTYIIHVEVRPWRFGWWVREVYTAYVP